MSKSREKVLCTFIYGIVISNVTIQPLNDFMYNFSNIKSVYVQILR